MRYVLIDPHQRVITEIHADHSLEKMHELMECDTVDLVRLHNQDLWVDDEGLFKNDQAFFSVDGSLPLCGKALVTTHNDRGNTTSATISVADMAKRVQWVGSL